MFASTVGFIIILEIASYHSEKHGGGLAFADTLDNLSTSARFIYLYLPTLVFVAYSMVWNWVDLDTKRLEPWLQMSDPNGAPASSSVSLQYPFDFLPFVPVKAARRRYVRQSEE
jgi:hypothetical protein